MRVGCVLMWREQLVYNMQLNMQCFLLGKTVKACKGVLQFAIQEQMPVLALPQDFGMLQAGQCGERHQGCKGSSPLVQLQLCSFLFTCHFRSGFEVDFISSCLRLMSNCLDGDIMVANCGLPFSVCFWRSSHQYGPKSHDKSKKTKYTQWATNKANKQKHMTRSKSKMAQGATTDSNKGHAKSLTESMRGTPMRVCDLTTTGYCIRVLAREGHWTSAMWEFP